MVPFQRYISPDLTHFVGRRLPNQEKQYQLLRRIIQGGVLQARPPSIQGQRTHYGLAIHTGRQLTSNNGYQGSFVCFCDIPLGDMALHMEKYSHFGLAFSKDLLAEKGAIPVMYIPSRGRPALLPFAHYGRRRVAYQTVAFDEFWRCFNRLREPIKRLAKDSGERQTASDLAKTMEFLDFNILSHLKFFDHNLHDVANRNYYMEREWRVVRNVRFALGDIQRIIIPERFSRRLRRAFPRYDREVFFSDLR